jgi:excisionase family DNA binding protein
MILKRPGGDVDSSPKLPPLLTAQEVADLYLRTTRKAIYQMVQRGQVPGVVRLGRRMLFRRDVLQAWIRTRTTPDPRLTDEELA